VKNSVLCTFYIVALYQAHHQADGVLSIHLIAAWWKAARCDLFKQKSNERQKQERLPTRSQRGRQQYVQREENIRKQQKEIEKKIQYPDLGMLVIPHDFCVCGRALVCVRACQCSLTLTYMRMHDRVSIYEVNLRSLWNNAVIHLVKTLRYKPEGHGFDSRWIHWDFSLT
jgi:hypothetical protein